MCNGTLAACTDSWMYDETSAVPSCAHYVLTKYPKDGFAKCLPTSNLHFKMSAKFKPGPHCPYTQTLTCVCCIHTPRTILLFHFLNISFYRGKNFGWIYPCTIHHYHPFLLRLIYSGFFQSSAMFFSLNLPKSSFLSRAFFSPNQTLV